MGLGLAGLFLLVAGYRLFKSAITVIGIFGGAMYAAGVVAKAYGPEEHGLILAAFILGAVVGGGAALGVYFAGIFAAGGFLGFIAGGMLVDQVDLPQPALWVIGLTVVFGLFTLGFQRKFLITLTSLLGSWHIVATYAWLTGGRNLLPYNQPYAESAWDLELGWWDLALWGVLAVAGITLQFLWKGAEAHGSAPAKPAKD